MLDLSKKDYQKYLLMNLIKDMGPISRTQLQEITELRPATISSITKELLENDIIKTDGSTNMGRGRNQMLLKIHTDYLCAICISIEVRDITAIISTLDGKIIKKVEKDISKLTSIKEIIDLILKLVDDIIKEFDNKKILGIGVGDPGLIDITGEYSLFSSQLKLWKDIPLKSILFKSFGLPVKLEVNDRLKALGERFFGLAKGIDNFMYVQLGQGIGISTVANGTLIRGYNGVAGEMGHTHTLSNNKLCACGSYGCLETIASLDSIVNQVSEAINSGAFSYIREISTDLNNITFEDIKQAVKLNDKVCLNIIENAGINIGIALANAINIMNPQVIIFGGQMCELGNTLIDPIKSAVYKNSLSLATSNLLFKVTELKESAAPLGAITLVIDDFFKTSLYNLTSMNFVKK